MAMSTYAKGGAPVTLSQENSKKLQEIHGYWKGIREKHGAPAPSLNEVLSFLLDWELEGRSSRAVLQARTGKQLSPLTNGQQQWEHALRR